MATKPEAPARQKSVFDGELKVMAHMERLLAKLPNDEARSRVVAYMTSRHVERMKSDLFNGKAAEQAEF